MATTVWLLRVHRKGMKSKLVEVHSEQKAKKAKEKILERFPDAQVYYRKVAW